jgi:hypothetical protein
MKRPSIPRSLLAVSRAGLALVVVHVSALTGCAGAAFDEAEPGLVEEATPLDEHQPASALLGEAEEPTSTESEASALGQLQQPLLGSDTCSDVYVSVRNFWSDPITVRSIEFYNASEGRWQTEDLANRTLAANGGLEIWVEDLQGTENDMIYSVNLLFDHLDHYHDLHFNLQDRRCMAGLVMFDLFVE